MDEIQNHIVELLKSGHAHDNFLTVASRFTEPLINKKVPGQGYTTWHLIEHIRIGQKDIIDYVIGTNYKELAWPKDFWPALDKKAAFADWKKTIDEYEKDLVTLTELIRKQNNVSVLKKALLVVDHTSYHVGELSLTLTALKKK